VSPGAEGPQKQKTRVGRNECRPDGAFSWINLGGPPRKPAQGIFPPHLCRFQPGESRDFTSLRYEIIDRKVPGT